MKLKLLLLSLLLVTSCNHTENRIIDGEEKNFPESFDYGKVKGNQYFQKYLGLEFTIDSTWIIQNKEQIKDIVSVSEEMFDDKQLKNSIKAAEVKVANLFAAFKYEVGSLVQYNPSIMIIAENLVVGQIS